MMLVNYPSSDEEEIKEVEEPEKKKRKVSLPPLPKEFEEAQDKKHDGRVRAFPHVEGNYPSHVFIRVEATEKLRKNVDQIVEAVRSGPEADSPFDIEPILGEGDSAFHISLSRPFALRWIDTCIEDLRKSITRTLDKTTFHLKAEFLRYEWLFNDERTRSFLTLRMHNGVQTVLPLITAVDRVMKLLHLPTYYETTLIHIYCTGTHTTLDLSLGLRRYFL
ncbi:hypothetical protein PROFUN_02532 [Planoprotostelium fungivorum]|uniref:U6 snRNA phosphodiesterase 1 n=1 Tax=Planoprotostelium fungivorum TaxID=1890364 RepID=A0A2P6MP82_9EUKA|nr:hypothetical protein PROFUN_02532 [Planoprotostelium fungivorum]